MTTECNAHEFDFQGLGSRAVTARFDGGAITSDAGGLLLREVEAGVKVSLRAKGEINVGRIAARFGGGGHANAAGCVIPGSLKDAKDAILRAVREAMKAGEWPA